MRGFMTKRSVHLQYAAALAITLGLAIPAAAQDAGPMPPAPASQPAPVAQKPQTPVSPDTPEQAPAPPAAAVPSSAPASAPAQAADAAPPANKAIAKIQVPSGTHIPLVLHNSISTRSARPGDPVYFESLFPIMIDGRVVIPAGSYISGEVTESKRPGRVKGRGELAIKLTTMILPNAYMVDLNAVPSNAGTGGGETVNGEGTIIGDSDKASDAGTVIKSTAAGAGIGGIATQSG